MLRRMARPRTLLRVCAWLGSRAEPRASTFGSRAEPRASTFGSRAEPRASTFGSRAEPRASTLARGPARFDASAVLALLGVLACDSAPASIPKAPPPPPFPGLSAKPVPAETPSDAPALTKEEAVAAHGSARQHEAPPNHAAKHASAEPAPPVKPSASQPKAAAAAPRPKLAAPTPAPAKPAPAPAKAPPVVASTPKPEVASKVSVPKTTHVQIDLPAGLQADLNHDPRMQPWVNQVVTTIDRCYGSESKGNTKLSGTIEVLVTMHENARPDADIKQLPPALSPIVACATGGLMRAKMPLFTGAEGSRYTVRLRFSP
jgi:hypothetical protein